MLKSSHLVTPRSMSEATWLHAYDPIERPEPKPRGLGRWVAFTVFAMLALTLLAGVA